MVNCDTCGRPDAEKYECDIDEIPLTVSSYYCYRCVREQLRELPKQLLICAGITVAIAVISHILMQALPFLGLE